MMSNGYGTQAVSGIDGRDVSDQSSRLGRAEFCGCPSRTELPGRHRNHPADPLGVSLFLGLLLCLLLGHSVVGTDLALAQRRLRLFLVLEFFHHLEVRLV